MKDKLKILLLEDSPDDATLVERELAKVSHTYRCMVVSTKTEFVDALKKFQPEVILADHSLPQFNSIEALNLYKKHERETGIVIPFILVTGNISEEFAIQSIKAGADDYILKDRLKRLPMAIAAALDKCRIETERRKYLEQVIASEALMREAEELAGFGSWQADLRTGNHKWSNGTYLIYGFKPGEIQPGYETFLSLVHPDDRTWLQLSLEEILKTKDAGEYEFRIINRQGNVRHIACKLKIEHDEHGAPTRLVGFNLDITERTVGSFAE
jgi:two-component system response regulator